MAELTGGHVNVVTGALVGGHELVSGVLGGVAGVFTGAAGGFREAGVAGAVGGLGRGVVGAATSTAAGAVGFAARVVEGIEGTVGGGLDGVKGGQDANAATRRRLPLAVRGDGVVRAYDAADAAGLKLLGDAFVRDASGGKKKPFAGGGSRTRFRFARGPTGTGSRCCSRTSAWGWSAPPTRAWSGTCRGRRWRA